MAAESYIQLAIAQVQSALNDLGQQIHSLQTQTNDAKHQLQRQIEQFEHERGAHQTELLKTHDSNQQRAVHERIHQINHSVDDLHAQMGQLDNQLAATANRKNGLIKQITQTMSQLNRFRSSPDMHLR